MIEESFAEGRWLSIITFLPLLGALFVVFSRALRRKTSR